MKKSILIFLFVGIVTSGFSQLQIGGNASYLKGAGDNNSTLWGGGIHAKIFFGNRIAFGAGYRAFPKSKNSITGLSSITTSDNVAQFYGSFDLLIFTKKRIFQPYIGVDAGVSSSTRSTSLTPQNTAIITNDNNQKFFYLAPKLGLNLGISNAFGLFAQATYGLTFGSGDPGSITIPNVETKPVDKFISFDLGLYFRLSAAK
jgi:hypothetical protein